MSAGKGLVRPGDYMPHKSNRFWNRTGATLKRGQFAMLDFLGTQAETTSLLPGGQGTSIWSNLTPVTQAGFDAGFPIVIAEEEFADNLPGQCCIESPYIDAAICDDDVSTTDIDRGDPVSILVSESAVAAQSWVTTTTPRAIGLALEDAAAATDASATQIDANSHLRKIVFRGGYPLAGFSDT